MENLPEKIKEFKCNRTSTDICTLEVTVPTGLEKIAISEIVECQITENVYFVPGRIYFNTTIDNLTKVMNLRSIDNVNLVIDTCNLKLKNNKDEDLDEIASLAHSVDFKVSVEQWAKITHFNEIIFPTKEQHDDARKIQDQIFHLKNYNLAINDDLHHNVMKYRVTCERSGANHSFASNDAAYKFGGQINNRFYWIVALSNWDINIILRICNENALICVKVTLKSLHRRCLVAFGPTSLRPTIAYCMLKLADVQPGEIFLDPLCGGGSLPIECMYGFPKTIVFCGDIHDKAVLRTLENVNEQLKYVNYPTPNIFHWNASYLPFKDHQIDVIVSDLPFGKRSGSRRGNVSLYKNIVKEFGRVLRLKTGRLVLLSKDVNHLYKALRYKELNSIWSVNQVLTVNVGDLKCVLILAHRNQQQEV